VVGVFAAIDHAATECVACQPAKQATRFEAREPIRPELREHPGSYSHGGLPWLDQAPQREPADRPPL